MVEAFFYNRLWNGNYMVFADVVDFVREEWFTEWYELHCVRVDGEDYDMLRMASRT